MESLAYIHNAIAYEDPNPAPIITLWQRFNGQKRPSSGWLKFLGISLIVAAAISLGEAAHAATMKVKTDTGLGMNVRSAPTINSDIVGGLSEGDVINVSASETSAWSRITEGSLAGKYVSSTWLVSVGTSSDPIIPIGDPAMAKVYVIKTNSGIGVKVRALPTTASGNIGGLGEGEKVGMKASGTPGWLQVTSGSYQGGYVNSTWAVSSSGSTDAVDPVTPNSSGNYTVRTNSGIGVVVRSSPTTASANIGGLGEGSVISATPAGNGWLQITSGSYAGGYISGTWAVAGGSGGTSNASNPPSYGTGNYVVDTNGGGLIVRSAPSTAARSIGGLGEGQRVSAVASGTGGWLVINSGPYAGGYISSVWVAPTSSVASF